jgi:deoxyribodipyrimidine photo-lyase
MQTSKKFEKALFIFRRDLRLEDNTGLAFALENAQKVILCFIFTPEQIENNPYRSDHCLQFMIESLEELEKEIIAKGGRLYLFYDKPEMVVTELIKIEHVDAVVVNRDYTPYSIKRDLKIDTACKKFGVSFYSFDDALLHPPDQTLKGDGKPYTVFTPFYRNAMKLEVKLPFTHLYKNYYSGSIPLALDCSIYKTILANRPLPPSGGRTAALKILEKMEQFSYYESMRDFPSKQGTTHLSAHLKFTTCSLREVYWAISRKLGASSALIRSLYWRDFFTSIAFYFPHVFSGAFHSKFDRIQWNLDEHIFRKWCDGKTGFPIVDAGMREMNQTGFMHNRVRMIAASFLVKDLHINWRWGERYFAQTLIDYDPAVNNGNWQWAASTGCDAQPYFRIFNPWTQALKFDPECLYIKKWIPELTPIPSEIIHKWHQEKYHSQCPSYPTPMVDHARESKIALSIYAIGVDR